MPRNCQILSLQCGTGSFWFPVQKNKAQTRTHPLDIREELKKLEELQATARKEWLGLALPL